MTEISEELAKRLNEHITVELDAFYAYLAMSSWFESRTMHNAAGFFKEQSDEEFEHAEKLMKFLASVGEKVKFHSLDAPKCEYGNVKEALKAFVKNEESVSEKINDLYKIATEKKDYAAYSVLLWFVDEQVEEEELANDMLQQYKYFENHDIMWDHHVKRAEK